ncbi:MAG TPA: copper amine oxidase N-terminal domain-containing protein, partial [Candidatus Baltobacteraceae bacterium]|nr:copper amine oxidase N-terminal domain-containing protein [Candidatus Baltobacteraceae bacterium]
MNSKIARRAAVAAIISASLAGANLAALAPAFAASVSVIVNGQQVSFDQPPIERTGRVFVPLRGVFERLGASVVYGNGVINATGNGRNISLRIGSTQATVNGQSQNLDVAPF